jgi:VanZ family protein
MKKNSLENTNVRFKVFLILSILYAMFIFYLSSRSSFGDTKSILGFFDSELIRNIFHYLSKHDLDFLVYPFYIFYNQLDKFLHIILYMGFGFLLYITIKNSSNPTLCNYALLFAIIIGTLYGASDEFHQSFVPGRTASIWDLAADSTGVGIAQIIIYIKDKLFIKNGYSYIYNKKDTSK